MPTYEYLCEACGTRFERRQAMTEPPLEACPVCRGKVRRVISGGVGFILKGSTSVRKGRDAASCSLEREGKTCCGRAERCGKPPCKGDGS